MSKKIDIVENLKNLAALNNLKLIEKLNGHFQIKGGAFLVNYYPLSKDKTAYVAGTKAGYKQCSPQKAVELALMPPPVSSEKVKRKISYKKHKARMIREGNDKCKWCGIVLTLETATIEHIIPLKRGGLDHKMNWALACEPCNKARGHDMPEIENFRKLTHE